MASYKNLRNPLFRNWVRGVYALRYLQYGLSEFIDDTAKKHHNNLLGKLSKGQVIANTGCNNCSTVNLLPDHPTRHCIQRNRQKCLCKDSHGRRKCPSNCCSRLYDHIILDHEERNPIWENSDLQSWCSDYFEVAKLYLGMQGHIDVHTCAQIDVSGLLTIAINNIFFKDYIEDIAKFKKARDVRNELLHSSKFEISIEKLETYLDVMIEVLEDGRSLVTYEVAMKAVENIEKVRSNQISITEVEAEEMIHSAVKAIEEKRQEAIQELTKECNSLEWKMQSSIALKTESSCEHLQRETDELRKKLVKDMEEQTKHLKHRHAMMLSEMEEKMTDFIYTIAKEEGKEQHLRQNGELGNQKMKACDQTGQTKATLTEVQQHLINYYRSYYLTTDVSPLLRDKDVHVDEVYVPLIFRVTRMGRTKTENPIIDSLTDLFTPNNKRLDNIYLSGEGGIGKTTLCRKLISYWCAAHSLNNRRTKISQEDKKAVEKMKNFKFLLFISLRHLNKETTIEDMVENQLLSGFQHRQFIRRTLQRKPKTCLFVLDGLDEWEPKGLSTHPAIPEGLPIYKNCYTKLFTSRPWKIESIRPKLTENDIELEVEGISMINSKRLVNVLLLLVRETAEESERFFAEIQKKKMQHLLPIPLLLKLLLCLWLEDKSLEKSSTSIYCAILDLLLSTAMKKNRYDEEFQLLLDNLQEEQLPAVFRNKSSCKKFSSVIMTLSKLAFQASFAEDREKSLVFTDSDLSSYGLSQNTIRLCLTLGLLSQKKFLGISNMLPVKKVSFLHKSLQELFAAIYISMQFSAETENHIHRACSTVENVFEFSNVFLFLSGMKPSIMYHISGHICKLADNDTVIEQYRDRKGTGFIVGLSKVRRLQATICTYLQESKKSNYDEAIIRLRDIVFEGKLSLVFKTMNAASVSILDTLFNITPCSIATLTLRNLVLPGPVWQYLKSLDSLHTIICDMNSVPRDCLVTIVYKSRYTIKHIHLAGYREDSEVREVYFLHRDDIYQHGIRRDFLDKLLKKATCIKIED
ncbi:uncharacterized protein LOC132750951 [Ruditapes philippinarum]|uniref:uncharacterized protein LOC132750951 n=1 Tax=Ruditapes philippinarum TaxID=129788 RepID=UPI00295AA881|nr:uncharacterized protein LOC132750951 [Ruditapes philippinarum]